MTAGKPDGDGSASHPSDAPPATPVRPSACRRAASRSPRLRADALHQGGGKDRFGLRAPAAALRDPCVPGRRTRPAIGGDLCVQACADDPQVAVHAVRNLARIAFATAACAGRSSGSAQRRPPRAQDTPRNLFGFKDGTANINAEDTTAMTYVWVGGEGDWLRRRLLPRDAPDPHAHRDVGPRPLRSRSRRSAATKRRGAPIGRRKERDTLDLARTADGLPQIPAEAHVRLRTPSQNGGAKSCAAATPSPTANDVSASSTPACSSSRTSATRSSSRPSSAASAPLTPSTNTSSTRAPPSSPHHRARRRAGYVGAPLFA